MEKYLYFINYPKDEMELCNLEMKALFKEIPKSKVFFSDIFVNPSKSPFIKEVIIIFETNSSLEDLVINIKNKNLNYDDFKINYIKLEKDECTYAERLNAMSKIGYVIVGETSIHNPKNTLAITKINGRWIFGEYVRNDYKWHIHQNKPNNYSNSIGIRIAKALINIATCNEENLLIVDPCCGIGTVVIEGLSMGENIVGIEINKSIAAKARRNLEFFGYDKNYINQGDINEINVEYDVAIIDLPYGLFTPIELEEQKNIINEARRIAKKLILITFEDMDEIIIEAGFTIIDRGTVSKGKFTRIIEVCI